MRIGEITTIKEYRMDKQFRNFQMFESNFGFRNKKNIPKISKILQF